MNRRTVMIALLGLTAALPVAPARANPLDDYLLGAGLTDTERCDALDAADCLLPLPNDHFTRPDASTDTGRRLDMNILSMPRNIAGKPIEPAEFNRNDGWSPGAHIITMVPGLDLTATGAVTIDEMASYAEQDAPIVVINALTGERHPIWAEMDRSKDGLTAETLGLTSEQRALLVRPARNWEEGTRYVVALRNLRTATGTVIPPNAYFRTYRDKIYTTRPSIEIRRNQMEDIFSVLGDAGIGRGDLYSAWDFTVASERNLSERILHMRDETFAKLGDTDLADGVVQGASPSFTVSSVTDTPGDPKIARKILGTVRVPIYLNMPLGLPGSRMVYGLDGLPESLPGFETDVDFECQIPQAASAQDPALPALYGHGLLGGKGEMEAGNVESMSQEQGILFCAADWWGMSTLDIPNVAVTLADLSNFSSMADRMQQGFLNFMLLGRALIHPDGFASNPAFQDADGNPLLRTGRLYYDGNSQGGIMGGAFMAITPDAPTGVLGVPGMNYSTLLDRSVDFDVYSVGVYQAYPRPVTQQIGFHLIQLLWDRGEANGYAQHMTDDPLPNTPAHRVLMHPAVGDHQVANVAAEVQARTIGAALAVPREMPDGFPAPWPGRHWASDPTFGLETWDGTAPYAGSVIVNWDTFARNTDGTYSFRTPVAPRENIPNDKGSDPHGKPRGDVEARIQKGYFLRTGEVIDVCGGSICNAE